MTKETSGFIFMGIFALGRDGTGEIALSLARWDQM
jgi:hypothetical protein